MRPLLCLPLALGLLATPAIAQTGTLDQVSPFASEAVGVSTASYNFSASSLTWQMETEAGFSGQLEGIELELTGSAGSSIEVSILLGPAWQAGGAVWTGTYTKNTASTEIAWIDVTSAAINLNAGDSYVIQVIGNDSGVNGTGTYESPLNNQYPLPLYLNGNEFQPEWKIGFHTYLLTGPSLVLSTSGSCGGNVAFIASGGTANSRIAFAYSFSLGSYTLPGGPCAGLTLGLGGPVQLGGFATADGFGNASLSAFLPSSVCGRLHVQAVDVASCVASNVVSL